MAENVTKKNEFKILSRRLINAHQPTMSIGMQKGFVNSAFLKKRLFWSQTPAWPPADGTVDAALELEKLREWVEISSASFEKSGVEKMQASVAQELTDLGFACRFLPHPEGKFADFLIGELKGETSDFITMICHTDTVLTSQGWRTGDDSRQAFGSGVIDNKGGLVVLVSALQRFLKNKPKLKYSLRVLCSPNEEVGSSGFIPVYSDHAKDTKFAFGFEPALSNGSIICKRRGNRWYDIEITGREAHAGRSRGEHANAAHDLAKKIVQLAKLGNPKQELAVNIGHLEGGQDRFNIICGFAKAKLDVRFASLSQREWLHQKIDAILREPKETSTDGRFATVTEYKIVDDCPPFSPSRSAMKLSRSFIRAVQSLEGRKILAESAGGAGDVNYLSREGVVVLDGFGPVGGEMHTRREFVEVVTLATRAMAMAHFLQVIQEH